MELFENLDIRGDGHLSAIIVAGVWKMKSSRTTAVKVRVEAAELYWRR